MKCRECLRHGVQDPINGHPPSWCLQLGNLIFPGHIPESDLSQYSLEADEDESVEMPPGPKGGNVQGKPRNFLPYAPSWAKHPDYDRVCGRDLTQP